MAKISSIHEQSHKPHRLRQAGPSKQTKKKKQQGGGEEEKKRNPKVCPSLFLYFSLKAVSFIVILKSF
jgi:hypothetical protein